MRNHNLLLMTFVVSVDVGSGPGVAAVEEVNELTVEEVMEELEDEDEFPAMGEVFLPASSDPLEAIFQISETKNKSRKSLNRSDTYKLVYKSFKVI